MATQSETLMMPPRPCPLGGVRAGSSDRRAESMRAAGATQEVIGSGEPALTIVVQFTAERGAEQMSAGLPGE